ncbi:armadillo repeat-containing protein 2 [Epargyreus clarus]|uniref:armadillo repeat-containing protein 2 n=1 Tax=Epargyreus clarus TaxID=520877 RepID=UPI003C2F87DA
MSERGARRGAGAPFYAPPRRKTSAEIISEARAAICAEMNTSSGGAAAGELRPLRTRRPFTPREPQRTLFTERARKRDARPPSAFDLKNLTLSETGEDLTEPDLTNPDDHVINELLLAESQINARKKYGVRNQSRPSIERSGDGWGGFPKLPHLSGRSKPLHRRNTTGQVADGVANTNEGLAQTISITRPLAVDNGEEDTFKEYAAKSLCMESGSRRKQFAVGKSLSYDSGASMVGPLGDVAVKHLAVQLPTTLHDNYENMSLLELAEALSQRGCNIDRTLALMEVVQSIIEKNQPATSLRDYVLRALYTHIDNEDEQVLVAIARAMLTMRVTGSHLAAAFKLVFKIARNDKNDHFFKNSNLLELVVEGCGRADPVSESECCVYAAGALRFLALEPQLCALAHRAGALHLAALHLKILNNAKADHPRQVSDQATHALYQVTGALRNLAGGGQDCVSAFATSGALAELVAALQIHTDRDVLTNVARCLSVVSAEAVCCAWLCGSAAAARALLRALAACAARAPLAVRLAYTLGNMAAADHRARTHIYKENGGVDVLLTILESYTKRNDTDIRDIDADPDLHLIGTDLGGSDGSNEDVLIKTVRVVANLCLSEAAGRALAQLHAGRAVAALLACLLLAEKLPQKIPESADDEQGGWLERREELATAALATLNNVTFYMESPLTDTLDEVLDSVCKATCRWVRGGAGAAGCEAVRALGNLTRSARAAQLAVLEGALDALPPFQRHEEPSVRCAAAGVLVNVCGAGAGAGGAAGAAAARALAAAAAARDAGCAALLARALWNAHAHRPLPAAHAHHAAAALTAFIDDDSVFAACAMTRCGDRRASDPELSKHHVTFDLGNNNNLDTKKGYQHSHSSPLAVRAYSIEEELHLEQASDEDGNGTGCSGEDLGFEEGEIEECECEPCRRLAAWEELVAIAIPLLEKLKPPRADASVGTDQ